MTSVVQTVDGNRQHAHAGNSHSARMAATSRPPHGYASIAGAHSIFDYNVFANQFNTQGQGSQRRLLEFAAGRKFRSEAFRHRRLPPAPAPLQQLDGRAIQLVVQRRSRASARPQPVRAPEQLPRQRRSSPSADRDRGSTIQRLRVQPLCVSTRIPSTIPDRPFDTPFTNLTQVQRRRLRLSGNLDARSWAQTTVGYNFEDENGYITQQLGTVDFPTSAPRTVYASTIIFSRRKPSRGSACRCWRASAT